MTEVVENIIKKLIQSHTKELQRLLGSTVVKKLKNACSSPCLRSSERITYS